MKTDTEPGGRGRRGRRNSGLLRLAVLVPHRDSRRIAEDCRPSLFAAGLLGAWSFPATAPLARLSRPLTAPELKALAAFLKRAALAGGRDGGRPGMIVTGKAAEVSCPAVDSGAGGGLEGTPRFWGPVLDVPVPAWGDICAVETAQFPARAPPVYSPFSAAVLCAALVPGGLPPGVSLPVMPALSFRAAAVANMTVIPLAEGAAGYSFRWRIGPLFWLPKNQPGKLRRGDS